MDPTQPPSNDPAAARWAEAHSALSKALAEIADLHRKIEALHERIDALHPPLKEFGAGQGKPDPGSDEI
jgi:hypothetical protein